ncbi:MAG TPA: BON domain-containing protein [Candidatus Binatia bacterium]|nr:BON domain-containing protein [Candidatus Binatia bacterium]
MKRTTVKYVAVCVWMATAAVVTVGTSGCAHSQYRRTTGQYVDDKTLTARVKTALFRDPNVSGMQVHVDSYEGVVALNGFVDTPEQKTKAEDVARQVQGVRQVQNNLAVRQNIQGNTSGTSTTR